MDHEMLRELEQCQAAVEGRLRGFFPDGGEGYATLLESMRYSLLAGGKRIRAVICMKFCEAAGGAPETALDVACAIEMLHTYSLIHDDLPCMDNDDMRRGIPSNHIKYGEFTAVLAGDALQAAAFSTLLGADLPPASLVGMARLLAQAAGPHGICGGQYLDLSGEGRSHSLDALADIYAMKTSTLISTAAALGVAAAGGTQEQADAAEEYAASVGFAFQARDDVLDCTATAQELGKPIGSDSENQKMTLAALLGVSKCEDIIRAETENAIAALDGKFADTKFLEWLAATLAERKK